MLERKLMEWLKKIFVPKPYNEGYLPEENGHRVFFQEFGNIKGKPVLLFHGGPGGSISLNSVKAFDLKAYRIIAFDQRGCGKSVPQGELKNNTTQDLLNDATRLLNHLNIKDKVILRGGSWGSTLALLWAESFPNRVETLLLSQIFLADENALEWENSQAALFYPEFVEQMKKKAGPYEIPQYYAGLINSSESVKQLEAINTYGWWERVRSSLTPQWNNCTETDQGKLASQRIYINYAAQSFSLARQQVLENADKIKNIPTLIVHNRLDFVCPLQGAYQLHKRLINSRLIIVPESGHIGKLLHKTIKKEIKKFLNSGIIK